MAKKLSQNKKIGTVVIMIFMLSFATMVLLLDAKSQAGNKTSKTSILDLSHGNHGENNLSYNDIVENKLFEITPVPTFMISPNGKMDYGNRAFCKMVDVDCEQLSEALFYDIVNAKDLPEIVSATTSIFYDEKNVDGLGPYRLQSGEKEIMVILNAKPVTRTEADGEKHVSHILFSARDITEQVREMQDFKDRYKKEQSDMTKEVDDFPQIKEINDEDPDRLMVDKIGFIKGSE